MKTSCGIIILNELNEVFMAHSTGNKFFDIPKGLLDDGESTIDCAVRECLEETSIIIEKEKLIDIGLFPYNKEKNLYIYFYRISKNEIEIKDLKCTSFFEDVYTKKMKPEADYFEWKDWSNVEQFCAKSMSKLITKLKEENALPLLTSISDVSKKLM